MKIVETGSMNCVLESVEHWHQWAAMIEDKINVPFCVTASIDGDVKVINVSKKIGSLMAHRTVSLVKMNLCVIKAAHERVLSFLIGRANDS